MFTDVVGYSMLTERDEKLALELLEEHRQILRQLLPSFGGREIKNTGDGMFVEFSSIVEAVNCAVAIQTTLFERNLSADESRQLEIRIGLHLGDVLDSKDAADDRYGSDVNIAARIEPLANAGGICISQLVFDHINSKIDLPFKKLGKVRLKNIREPIAVYRIVLPWEPQQVPFHRKALGIFAPKGPKTAEGFFLGTQVAATLGILGFIFVQLWHPVKLVVDRGPTRSIASVTSVEPPTVRHLDLPQDWQYAVASDAESSTVWKDFDVTKTLAYADDITGDYLLRLDFTGAGGFRHPAMVLGLISDVHRVYLNGQFIGGSERFADLAVYSFDPSLLRPGEQNTLLIKARTRPSFSPGINLLADIPSQIGEFEDVSRSVLKSQFSFRFVRPICLAISLLLAVASMGYYLIRRTELKFLYFASFLFLGSLCLTYYNTFVVASLSYPFYRSIKLFSLGLSSFVLFSLYLHMRGLKRLEAVNGLLALVFGAVSFFTLLGSPIKASQYIGRYNSLLTTAAAYTFVWLGVLALRGSLKLSKPVELRAITRKQITDVALVTGFGLIIALLCTASIMNGEQAGIFSSYLARSQFKNFALVYPFFFAMMVLGTGLADYTRKSKDISYKRKKDDLILSIANLAANTSDTAQVIEQIQCRVTEFLGAARSTIYLLHPDQKDAHGHELLQATYIHGPVGTKERIRKTLEPSSGIIGYCLAQKSAVFVEDLAKDPRFNGTLNGPVDRTTDGSPGYRTGSFMVFPLLVGSHLLGAITIADRLDGRPFTREDFCLMHLVAKDIAFMISHSQLQASRIERAA